MFGLREFCCAIGQNNVDVFAMKSAEKKYLDYIFPLDEVKENFVASDYDLVVLVDIHRTDRVEEMFKTELAKCENVLVIDHHIIDEKENFTFKNYRDEIVASCSQMMIDLYKAAEITPTADAATYIYAGLMGDTDRFLHSNVDKKVFECAIYLLEAGAKIQHVYNYLYSFKTHKQLELNKFFLKNLRFIADGRCGFIVISEKDKKWLGISEDDIKSFSNEIVRIKDVDLSFLCYEKRKGTFKVSLRSLGDINLVNFSVKMGGGGHVNASGFDISGMTAKKIKKSIPFWAEEILNG